MKDPKISIVCSLYNRAGLLLRTIETIKKSKFQDYEIVVVDDASDIPFETTEEKVKVIRLEKNTKYYNNPCIPYNIGFKAAKGEIIIIQNPECRHEGDILTYVNENIRENDYLSISCYNANPVETEAIERGDLSVKAMMASDTWYNHPYHRPINFHFCCAITRKNLFEDLNGGFDERYAAGMGFDDTEFIRRVYRKGINVVQCEYPFVIHQWHDRNYQNSPDLFDLNSRLYESEYLPGEKIRLTELTKPRVKINKPMKLGVSYNVFDGTELLRESILSIKLQVDHISVVYQSVSNFGNQASEDITDLLMDLLAEELINDIIYYIPDLLKTPAENELNKRNLGYINSMEHLCTHHLSMDCDEFYDEKEFSDAKKVIQQNNIDSSACSMKTYYKNNTTILWPIEEYYVPFIYKIRPDFMYSFINWPILVDPTRRIIPGNFYLFDENWITMHHFSYVRNNIEEKLTNSSASVNWMREKQNAVVEHFENWKPGDKVLCISGNLADTKQVEPKFLLSWDFSRK